MLNLKKIFARKQGFTMVELIIVIAIIAILAGVIFVAVDPARRLHEARNARRSSDTNQLLDALIKYQADNEGNHLAVVAALGAGNYYAIGTDAAGCNLTCTAQVTQAACANLTTLPATYISAIPLDPNGGTAANTDYYIMRSAQNNLKIGACDPEGEDAGGGGVAPVISVSR